MRRGAALKSLSPLLGLLLTLSTLAGCGGPAPVKAPEYNAAAATAAAFTDYDKNNDGKLDAKEVEKCPALQSSLAELDKDNDKAISKEELETRLAEFARLKVGLITASVVVTRGGAPLPNAEVKFVPEKFHGDSIKPASGKSDAQGIVELRTEGNPYPGIALGFYRIEISLKDAAGQETIPAAYNAQTTLGRQVGPQMRGAIELKLP